MPKKLYTRIGDVQMQQPRFPKLSLLPYRHKSIFQGKLTEMEKFAYFQDA